MAKILIIEDDKEISNLLTITLNRNYNVEVAKNGADAIFSLIGHVIDLIILDLGLPDIDGQDLLVKIRSFNSSIPLIVLSARNADEDKVKALDNGANDYVTKPFSAIELEARIRNLLRQNEAGNDENNCIFINKDLSIDYLSHQVKILNEEIKLTNYEYKILVLLSKNVGKTLTHNYIIANIWGSSCTDSGSLRVFVSSLRKKIEKDPYNPIYIRTDSGIGYRMNKL